jgi:hypothetical protein
VCTVYRRFVWRRFVEETFCRGDVWCVRLKNFRSVIETAEIYQNLNRGLVFFIYDNQELDISCILKQKTCLCNNQRQF